MAFTTTLESWKRNKIFLSRKEGTAFTADTNAFIEGRGRMVLPEPEYNIESNYNKLGSGEHGTYGEIQAVTTSWSYTTAELSEIAYFLAYFMGRPDPAMQAAGGSTAYVHELKHLNVDQRELPTFTMEFGSTSNNTSNIVISGNVVNEFSLNASSGGTGVWEATFSGFGNRHSVSNGQITANSGGSMNSASQNITSEPMCNYKACNFWMADALESNFGKSSVDFSGEDLGANLVNLTSLMNSFTIGGTNGMSAADMTRAGGSGVINDRVRGDRRFTLEFVLRKDDQTINSDNLIINDTQKAFELLFSGPEIESSYPYAIDIFLPVVELRSAPADDASPVSKAYTTEVYEDSNGDSLLAYVQSAVSVGYNSAA